MHNVVWPRGVAVTALVALLVVLELWAVNHTVMDQLEFELGGISARDMVLMLDLGVLSPLALLATGLAWLRPDSRLRRAMLAALHEAASFLSRYAWLGVIALYAWLQGTDLAGFSALVLVGVELLLLGLLIIKLAPVVRTTAEERRSGHSLKVAIQIATTRAFKGSAVGLAVRVAVAELALLCSGVVAWAVPRRQKGPSFTNHRTTDDTLSIGAVLIILLEIVPVHLLAHHYSPLLAWILTALSIYSLLWLIGDLVSRRTHPHVLLGDRLRLCHGLRQEAVVNLQAVLSVTEASPESVQPEAVIGGEPAVIIELAEPVPVYGWLGAGRDARLIGVTVDEPRRFMEVVTAATTGDQRDPESRNSIPESPSRAAPHSPTDSTE